MLADAFYIARMDTRHLLMRRETLIWAFVMPVVFFYFIGAITGNSFHDNVDPDPIAVRVDSRAGFLADAFLDRLQSAHYRVIRPQSAKELQQYARRLEIPAGFSDALRAGEPSKLHFARIGDDASAQFDAVRIDRALYSLTADLALAGPDPTPQRLAELATAPHAIAIDVRPAGKRNDIPSGFEQSVPGTMVMFTLLVLFTSGAVSLTIERRNGILRRLASSPMSRGAVVLGKWGSRMAIGCIQIAFAMITGAVLFHVHWGANLPAVALVLLSYGGLAAALALLLGNAGRTESQVIAVGVICSNVLAGLGGCWWPIEVTPPWSQKMAVFLPTGLTMNALHKLVNFGAPASAVWPHVLVLLAAAGLALYALSRTFRFE